MAHGARAKRPARLSPSRIGRVRGAADNSYTAGVVCAKVARYAERQHHPDRLSYPLRRVGPKGQGITAFQPISWEEAMNLTASAMLRVADRHGPASVAFTVSSPSTTPIFSG